MDSTPKCQLSNRPEKEQATMEKNAACVRNGSMLNVQNCSWRSKIQHRVDVEEQVKLVEEEKRLREREIKEKRELKRRENAELARQLEEKRKLAEKESLLRERELKAEAEMNALENSVRRESFEKKRELLLQQSRASNLGSQEGYIPSKKHRKQRCLKGNALELVKDQLTLKENVPDILETLKMIYGKPSLFIRLLLNKIRYMSPPRPDRLRTVIEFGLSVQALTNHMKAAKLNAHLNNPTLLKDLAEKLPGDMKLNWAAYQEEKAIEELEGFRNSVQYANVKGIVFTNASSSKPPMWMNVGNL
uniref:Uncharacterized protein n=1 Tax=Anopheles arabiensis TaxID=7173 RepID=A0A182I0X9_ANOAR